ncbi:MAG TPA: lipopolysaccharide biosynthesis protein [Steroidobacteraceae bacterium]|nr:lipopolysaccharide biosynthesis protein [Steroidobacteraceae bacterium]
MPTSSNSQSLDRALVAGIAWTAVLRWTAQAVSWVATFYVARVLVPGDYGIVSMAMLGIGFLRMVEDFGFDSILVQDRGIVGTQQARLAGLILSVGMAFCACLILLAKPIAGFFKEPQVAAAIAALSLLFLTDALQVVPRATLQRRLQFRRIASLALVQTIATQAVLVGAAVAGWGFWSLIASTISGAVVVTAVLLAWCPYSLAWPRQLGQLALPLLQGWRVIVGRIAGYAFGSADQLLIGRVLGKDLLGAYSFATTFAYLPFQEVSAIVSKVVPGVFSDVQRSRAELRRYFLLLTEFLAYLTLPMSIGLALVADLAVRLALGPKWGDAVGPLRLLCLYAAFQGCQILIAHVLTWTGQFRALMWCTVLAGVVLPLGFLIAVHHGLEGVALVWAVVYPLVNIPPLILGFRTIDISYRDWFGSLKPAGIACAAMSMAVLLARLVLPPDLPVAVSLTVVVGLGALVYAATLWFGFHARVRAIIEFVNVARGRPSTTGAAVVASAPPARAEP